MKHLLSHLLAPILAALLLAGCALRDMPQSSPPPAPSHSTPPSSAPLSSPSPDRSDAFFQSYQTQFPSYAYDGEMSETFDERTFVLEDAPENITEELVVNSFRFSMAGDFDRLSELMGNKYLKPSAENDKKRFEEGAYFVKNTIHGISVLTEQDFKATGDYFSDGAAISAFIDDLWDNVSEYGLSEYTVVYIDLSWEWSEIALQYGPQLDDGRYERLYLVGKTGDDAPWKIYELFWGEYVFA